MSKQFVVTLVKDPPGIQSRNISFLILMCHIIFAALLLVFGIFFAWETRKVRIEALNDSKQIGLCVYNVLITSAIAVLMSMVSNNTFLEILAETNRIHTMSLFVRFRHQF